MMIIERGNTKVCFCQETLAVTVEKDQTRWEWADGFQPKLICKEGSFSFLDAVTITHETYTMGVGIGIRSCFEGFEKDGVTYPYAFETLIWMEDTTEQVYFEWVPLKEEGLQVEKVLWPGQMAFEEKKDSWYTLLTHQQGILIPNDWEIPLSAIPFAGFFETAGGYMPWFGQVKDRQGYIAICTTPWNAGYYAEHPAGAVLRVAHHLAGDVSAGKCMEVVFTVRVIFGRRGVVIAAPAPAVVVGEAVVLPVGQCVPVVPVEQLPARGQGERVAERAGRH